METRKENMYYYVFAYNFITLKKSSVKRNIILFTTTTTTNTNKYIFMKMFVDI